MAIQIIDGFQVNTALPIDNRIVASGSTARNAIPYKYEGLRVFDTSDSIPYVYIGGTWSSENASGVLASGTTTNYIPKLNGTNVVGNSVIYQNGSNIGVSTTSPTAKLDVNGTVNATAITTADGSGILQVNATNITTGTLPLSRLQGFASTGQIIVAGSSFPSWTNQNQLSVGTSSFALTASSVKLSTSSGTSNYNYIPFVNNTSQSALYVDTSFVYDDIYNNLLVGSIRLGSTTGLTMSFGKVNYGSFTAQNNYSGVSANMTVGYVQVSNSINFKVEATFVGYTSAPFSGGGFASWAMIQLFSHGINVLGLWIVADIIEQQTGTRSMQQMGGLAKKQPTLAILLVGFALANIALPLTNAFVGEFLMFNSLFQYNVWVGAAAGVSIILAAIYTLNMVQKVAYGEVSTQINQMQTINKPAQIVLIVLLIIVFVTGIFPQPLFDLTADSLQQIFVK